MEKYGLLLDHRLCLFLTFGKLFSAVLRGAPLGPPFFFLSFFLSFFVSFFFFRAPIPSLFPLYECWFLTFSRGSAVIRLNSKTESTSKKFFLLGYKVNRL